MASNTMFAIRFHSTKGGIENNMSLDKDVARPPALKDGESLVRVAYAALNPADQKFAELPGVGGLALKLPATPAMDYSGRVVETRNPALKPGQLVFGRLEPLSRAGTVAEYTVASKEGTAALPQSVSLAHGAAIGTAAISAWQCLAPHLRGSPPGQRVLVNGASGGTGTWGVQLAKALGAHVTGTCSGANAELVRGLGADEVLDYRQADVSETLSAAARADEAAAMDLVFDAVGAPADLYKAADVYLRSSGHFNQIGGGVDVGSALGIASRMMRPGLLGGGHRPFKFLSAVNRAQDLADIAALVAEGKAKAVVDSTFKIEETAKAYERLRTGRARGKVLVEVGGDDV